jgi:L-rhamnose-H+ transport protein
MNVLAGIFYHALGSFASGSFMAPYVKIRKWNFENYWILMGLFAWILTPIAVALVTVPGLIDILRNAPPDSLSAVFLFGFFWGIGAVTFGLSVRYLGYSLGYALSLGLSSIIGTLLPPLFFGTLVGLFSDLPGKVLMMGLLVNFSGILFCIKAGAEKDKDIDIKNLSKRNSEYNYRLGVIVAIICGFFASFTGFGITAGKAISRIAVEHGTSEIMSNNATLVILLFGGFLFNFLWYLFKNWKKNLAIEFVRGDRKTRSNNCFFSAISGILWYLQYMFYGMGTIKMGDYGFTSWTIHMTLIIAFSNLWGLIFKEWKLCSRQTRSYAITGIMLIIISTMIIGYSSYLTS